MKIIINDSRKIFAIQEEFNKLFPYLKLEFLLEPHKSFEAFSKETTGKNSKSIYEFRSIQNSGEIIITPQMTVSELGRNFANTYGLNVQVFRKSGKSWLGATVTGNWTLEEQNNQGGALSEMSNHTD